MEARNPTAPGQMRVNDMLGHVPPGGLTQETAIFAVVGSPVQQSLSPWVHGMALKNAHLDAVYLALEPSDWERFVELYDDMNFRGLSVTAPFKERAFELASMHDEASSEARACNTLVRDGDSWRGYNTDSGAIAEVLETACEFHGREPGRPVALGAAHVLLLGTGGAARAAAVAVANKAARLTIAGRDAGRARALARETGLNVAGIGWDEIPGTEYDIIVHCTPVGSGDGGESPIPDEWVRESCLVLDAVYRPINTALLRACKRKGGTPVPGGEWFVRQAAAQFQLFTHQEADDSLMRAAFEHGLIDSGSPPSSTGGR